MASASDDFNRANNASIGANWTQDSGSWGIDTNAAEQVTGGGSYRQARYTATTPATNDMYSEVVAQSGGASVGRGAGVRIQSGAVTGYSFQVFGGDAAYLVETAAGAETLLDTGSAVSVNTNYTIRCTANGTSITGTLNGAADTSATDATLASGGWGMVGYEGDGTASRWDSWTATDLSAPAATGGFLTTMSGVWGP